ncbi:MAG: hypothetical protein WCR97_01200 [Bacilli bacterium]
MNNVEIASKFSNEKYCTHKEVMEELKMPLIDGIWNTILEYRSHFVHVLNLKHINGTKYNVCLTPTISDKVNNIERKLMKIMATYLKMNNLAEKDVFRFSSYELILKSIAEKYSLKVDDDVIHNIVSGNASSLSPDLMILNRYFNCLVYIENNPDEEINDNFYGKLYSLLLGTDELTQFYRENEVDNAYSKVLIGKLYLGVPTSTIEDNMDQLVNFIKTSDCSMIVKAAVAYYFFIYVKPFESYSEELALLTFKKILCLSDLGGVASLLNFEKLFANKDEMEKYILESQKTFDLTYVLNYIIRLTEPYLEEALDLLSEAQRTVIKGEIYQSEEKNILNKTPSVNQSNAESFNNVAEEFKKVQNPNTNTTNSASSLSFSQSIAINNLPTGLNEEDAENLENHLIEMNPNLSRGQAYFYARHCTLGMNYTISQYKKNLGCAYETARSSMDHLVYLGYYRKELLKNKFIYTPVKKG